MPALDVRAIATALGLSISQARRFVKRPFLLKPVRFAPSGAKGGGRTKLYCMYDIMSRAVTEIGASREQIQLLKEAAK